MSTENKTTTTTTVGYFNANRWPIHLIISELNVTLRLKPGEFILDKARRKINDSFFDKYTKPFQLCKEVSQTPVPLIEIPRRSNAAPVPRTNPVSVVTKFTEDRQPIIEEPKQAPAVSVNAQTHVGMSMEEARKRGLIGIPRVVPEDYGATDTDGRPPTEVPQIKYSMESTPRVRTVGALPKELTQIDDKVSESQKSVRSNLVSTVEKAASSDAEGGNFLSQVKKLITPTAQTPAPVSESIDDLPMPNVFSSDQVVDSSGQEAPKPPAETVPVKPASSKSEKPFVCSEDGQSFKYRSQLETYVKRKYPEKLDQLMANYPKAR